MASLREGSRLAQAGDHTQDDEPQTRQALVRKAMAGLQRFKQSWKSVMLLKAGVGLGQVCQVVNFALFV